MLKRTPFQAYKNSSVSLNTYNKSNLKRLKQHEACFSLTTLQCFFVAETVFLYSPHMVRYIEPIFLICLYWAQVQYVFLFSGYAICSNFPAFFSFFFEVGCDLKEANLAFSLPSQHL